MALAFRMAGREKERFQHATTRIEISEFVQGIRSYYEIPQVRVAIDVAHFPCGCKLRVRCDIVAQLCPVHAGAADQATNVFEMWNARKTFFEYTHNPHN